MKSAITTSRIDALCAHGVGNLQRVGLALAQDPHPYGLCAVGAHKGGIVGHPRHHSRHIAQAHRITAHAVDHDVSEILDAAQPAVEAHGHLAVDGFHLACGQFEVVAQECCLDIRYSEVARGKGAAVDPDAHGKGLRADHIDIGHPVEG
jgi:hypothetical protein